MTEGNPRDGMKWRQMSCFCDGSSQKKKKEGRYGIAPTNPKVLYMTSNSAMKSREICSIIKSVNVCVNSSYKHHKKTELPNAQVGLCSFCV